MGPVIKYCFLIFIYLIPFSVFSQLTISGQFRTRSEIRQGQGSLPEDGAVPAFFTSQRTRLIFSHESYRIQCYSAIQDVRVWGQDISSVNRTDVHDGLMLHEAWVETNLLDTSSLVDLLAIKIGRQELVYNDHRLLGNLDWLQQGRRHDMAVIKFADGNWTIHSGIAFNQNKENKSGTIYYGNPMHSGYPNGYSAGTNGIGTMYKSLQFLYLNRKWRIGNISFLLIKDDFNKYSSSGSSVIYERGVWSRLTSGVVSDISLKKLNTYTSVFYQAGKDKDGTAIRAWLLSVCTNYPVSSRFTIGPGMDFTSGDNQLKPSSVNRSFDPLYGTPHKFWGYMDYFYVADGFGKSGLFDCYFKLKYRVNAKLISSLDIHEFYSGNKIANMFTVEPDGLKPRLGTEADWIATYTITPVSSIEFGYCIFWGTETLDFIKNPILNNKDIGHWAYMMFTVKPSFLAIKKS